MEELGISVRAQKQLDAIFDVIQSFDDIEKSTADVQDKFKDLSDATKNDMAAASEAVKNFEKNVVNLKKESGDIDKITTDRPGERPGYTKKDFEGIRPAPPEMETADAPGIGEKITFDETTRGIIDNIKKIATEGSDDLKKINEAFQELKEKGKEASKEQVENLQQIIREYKALARQKLTPTQIEEKDTLQSLENRLKVPDLDPTQTAILSKLIEELKAKTVSRQEIAEVDIIESRIGEIHRGIYEQEQDPVNQFNRKVASTMKKAGSLVLGGSIIGFGLYSIKHWADLDSELKKVDLRFDGMRNSIDRYGIGLGKTIRENIEFAKSIGTITDRFSEMEASQIMGYAKATGTSDAAALQLRLAGRFVETPGIQRYLTGFDQFAQEMGMYRGRREELQNVTAQLARIGARQTLDLGIENIYGVGRFAREFWGDQYKERGMGDWGADFINRMNAAMTQPGSDAARSFMMRAYGFGDGKNLIEVEKMIEAGIFGEGNLEKIISQLFAETKGMSNIDRTKALKGLTGGALKTFEAERLIHLTQNAIDEGKDFKDIDFIRALRPEQTQEGIQDWARRGRAEITIGEKYKTFIDRVQKELGGTVDVISDLIDLRPDLAIKKTKEAFDRVKRQLGESYETDFEAPRTEEQVRNLIRNIREYDKDKMWDYKFFTRDMKIRESSSDDPSEMLISEKDGKRKINTDINLGIKFNNDLNLRMMTEGKYTVEQQAQIAKAVRETIKEMLVENEHLRGFYEQAIWGVNPLDPSNQLGEVDIFTGPTKPEQ